MGPISHSADKDLVDLITQAQAASADDSSVMNALLRRFSPLASKIAQALTDDAALRDDLANAALIGLTRAVRHHDLGREGFVTYATRYMRGEARRELERWVATPKALPIDHPAVLALPAPADSSGSGWGDGRVAGVVATLSRPQQRLLHLRYVEDAPLKLIAAAGGTSVPAVSQRLATAHRAVARLLSAA
jgi:RNA polymerase sigma factor (sigma-70 family)